MTAVKPARADERVSTGAPKPIIEITNEMIEAGCRAIDEWVVAGMISDHRDPIVIDVYRAMIQANSR